MELRHFASDFVNVLFNLADFFHVRFLCCFMIFRVRAFDLGVKAWFDFFVFIKIIKNIIGEIKTNFKQSICPLPMWISKNNKQFKLSEQSEKGQKK